MMTVAELISALKELPQDLEVGAVPSWGCTIIRARRAGVVVADVEMPTDPDVWPVA